jgi:acetyltransferase-like isoleucine patch superfamily enzyme
MLTSNLDQHPSATVASTAVIGAPYRRLQQDKWNRINRPTTIGAHCDIGPFCVVEEEAVIGEGTVLDSYTLIGRGATIGKNVIAEQRASIGAKARIGDGCVICERSVVGNGCWAFGDLIHRQLDPAMPWDAPKAMENSPILEDGVFIGWGATVTGDIKIGKGAYVCAEATVTRDVDPGKIVKGTNEIISPNELAHNMRDHTGRLGGSQRGPRRRRGKWRIQQRGPNESATMVVGKPNAAAAASQPYRPRDDRSPRDILDAGERFVSRAIDSEEMLGRSLRFMGWVTLLAGMLMLGLVTLVVGIAVAVKMSGLSPWIAGGIGITGTVAGSIAGWAGHRRPGRRGIRTENEPCDEPDVVGSSE